MRALALLSLLALGACVGADSGPSEALKAQQVAACTATIAQHVNKPEDQLEARWAGLRDGVAVVELRDRQPAGVRLHLCLADGAARVLGYEHPPA